MANNKKRKPSLWGRYQVTAANRLTGKREAITLPCQYEQARNIFEQERIKPANKRAYIRPKLERARSDWGGVHLELF